MSMLDDFAYELPEGLIAQVPAEPRESARLLVYDTARDEVSFRTPAELPEAIPPALFIYNDTRVLPARVRGVGAAGKEVELLVLVDRGFGDNGEVRALVNRFTPVGEVITVAGKTFTVLDNVEKSMRLQFEGSEVELTELLQAAGATPLPPYIESPACNLVFNDQREYKNGNAQVVEASRREQYQTMFAKEAPSVAAPTASLHFTPALVEQLEAGGSTFAPVTLQVGLGTFAPVFDENFANKKLHSEQYFVPDETAQQVAAARQASRPIVGIGTTVVRTLESAKATLQKGEGTYGTTDMFIFPPYTFTYPDILMTNFHVPKSSLLCLVQAYLEHKGAKRHSMELYEIAIKEKFRFYSFGDAMLIL